MINLIRYFKLFKKFTGRKIYIILFLTIIAAFFEGIGITLFLPLLNQESNNAIGQFVSYMFDSIKVQPTISVILIGIVLFFICRTIFLIILVCFQGKVESKLLIVFREQLLKKFFESRYVYFIKNDIGYWNNAMTVEIKNIVFVFKLYVNLIISFLFAFIYFILAVLFDYKLIFAIVVLSIPIIWIVKWLNKKVACLSISITKASGKFQSVLIQSLEKFKYLKATFTYPEVSSKIHDESRKLGWLFYQIRIWGALGEYGFFPIVVILIAVVVWLSVVRGGLKIAEIMFFLFLIKQTSDKILSSQANYRKLINHVGSIMLYEKVSNDLTVNTEVIGEKQIAGLERNISFKEINFNYGEKVILKNVNMEFSVGEIRGIHGVLGTGKSTIFNLITGLLKPVKGEILLDGIDTRNLDINSVRSMTGYVTQEDIIFNDTLYNNLTFWQDKMHNKIEQLIDRLDLGDFWGSMPKGYDTFLGERGIKISGGQRKIIFLLRELLKEPRILLLDEFSSAIDSSAELAIMEKLQNEKSNRVIVIISHNLSLFKYCDWIYQLKEGTVCFEGNYSSLENSKNIFGDIN